MPLGKRAVAEFFGTFWLVFGGCGSAVLAAGFPNVGIGFLGVAFAFGLTVLTMCLRHRTHLRRPFKSRGQRGTGGGQALPCFGSGALRRRAGGGGHCGRGRPVRDRQRRAGFDVTPGFASNGYGVHSPGGYSLLACFVAEVVLTMFFLIIIMGATDGRAPKGFAPIAIGLGLTLIHLVGIPVTNTSVNPARSTGPAIFVGGWALQQLWMFWVAPLIGGALGGGVYKALFGE